MGSKPRWPVLRAGCILVGNIVLIVISPIRIMVWHPLSFIDYLAGRRQASYYFPNPISSYLTKQRFQPQISTAPHQQPTEILKDELFRNALRKRFGFQ